MLTDEMVALVDGDAAVLTAVGDDELGRYVRTAFEGFGVDTRFIDLVRPGFRAG